MSRKQQTKGTCAYCGRNMTRSGLGKHLMTCEARAKIIEESNANAGPREILYHLQVQDNWDGNYWLHLEMPGKSTLEHLDMYLRSIWLECCGHMSQFSFEKWGQEISMYEKAGNVFEPGMELVHIYDFGDTSETKIKVLSARQGKPTTTHPIVLMARNNQPEDKCIECGAHASWLCVQCLYEDEKEGTLCEMHVEDHPHEDYGGPMQIVNSPRVGMCGYDGPAEPPY